MFRTRRSPVTCCWTVQIGSTTPGSRPLVFSIQDAIMVGRVVLGGFDHAELYFMAGCLCFFQKTDHNVSLLYFHCALFGTCFELVRGCWWPSDNNNNTFASYSLEFHAVCHTVFFFKSQVDRMHFEILVIFSWNIETMENDKCQTL